MRRSIGLVGFLFLTASLAGPSVFAERPNVILIMADDLGYETIGANGGTSYRTPNLDKLAKEGTRFTHCYVQPLCTPTRVQLMTGLYNVRNYVRFGYIDPNARTFAHELKDVGYSTCITGKWQLGQATDLPQRLGFDESCLWQHTRRPSRYINPGLEYNGMEKDFSNGEYGPDLVNEYAVDFVTRHAKENFLLYYPMILTHSPYQPTPDSPNWDPSIRDEKTKVGEKHFGEMVEYMDKMIGKLIDKLDELKIRENTLVIFLGDNGTGKGTASMMGDRRVEGGKGSTKETGMHVPLIVSWPKHLQAGLVSDRLVDCTDFYAALVDAVGATSKRAIDGKNFLPTDQGRAGEERKWIYSWYSPRQDGDKQDVKEMTFNHRYKLYRDGSIFDVVSDPQEKQPLDRAKLNDDAKTSIQSLQLALDSFNNVRPPKLDVANMSDEKKRSDKAGAKEKKRKKKAEEK
jgi:arylsulfatase A